MSIFLYIMAANMYQQVLFVALFVLLSYSCQPSASSSLPAYCRRVRCAKPKCPNPYTPQRRCCPVCPDCSAVLCKKPTCSNPITPPGKCCPECPDCSAVLCLKPDCPNPITPPGECCPQCPDCSRVRCKKPTCKNPVTPPGKCCPQCPDCSAVLCKKPTCPNPITPPGECCPQCPDCSAVLCPRPLCANPTLPPGECCPTCDDSNCKFKGCVNFQSNGEAQWSPSPCFICVCNKELNQQFCAIIDCVFLTKKDCFGYPVVTRPNECCPRCDFGVPDDTCKLVPQVFGRQNITVSATPGTRACSKTVVKRTCDKLAFRSKGKKFRCDPVEGKRVINFEKRCPLCKATYTDVTRCKIVQDDDVITGCDLFIK